MVEKETINETAKALGLKELAPQVYIDLLQPAAQEVGKSLVTVAKVVTVALSPLQAAVWGYEELREWIETALAAKLAKKDPDKIVAPALNIAVPALGNIALVADEPVLRDFYANLLATAMDTDTQENAHPSFAHIIKQLSGDEARLLKYVYETPDVFPTISVTQSDSASGALVSKASPQEQHRILCGEADLVNIGNSEMYVENLIRLGIFRADHASMMIDRGDSSEKKMSHWMVDTVLVSDLGKRFMQACMYDTA